MYEDAGPANIYGMVICHNDETESKVAVRVKPDNILSNSSKGHTGYISGVLGAAEVTTRIEEPC